MQVVAYRLYGAGERRRFADRSAAVVRGWSADWFPGLQAQVRDVVVPGAEDTRFRQLIGVEVSGSAMAGWMPGPEDYQFLIEAMAGIERDSDSIPADDPLLPHAVDLALADLILRLDGTPCEAASLAETPLLGFRTAAAELAPGSGALYLALAIGRLELHIYLSRALAARWLGAQVSTEHAQAAARKLERRGDIVEARTVDLQVWLRPQVLSAGEVLQLRVGDVLALEHPLHEPLSVRAFGGPELGTAYLGMNHHHRAIQLA